MRASTLLVWGDQDDDTPLWMGRRMEELIPDAGLVVLEGAGHYSYADSPGQFRAVARRFLLEQPREAAAKRVTAMTALGLIAAALGAARPDRRAGCTSCCTCSSWSTTSAARLRVWVQRRNARVDSDAARRRASRPERC